MNERQNDAVWDTVPEPERAADEVPVPPADDETANTPIATQEIELTATGERTFTKREQWLRELNRAIADYPEAPTNYVLRGELALETRDYEQAVADFEKALALAAAQVETDDWGIVAQTMQDRAFAGLAQARRRLTR